MFVININNTLLPYPLKLRLFLKGKISRSDMLRCAYSEISPYVTNLFGEPLNENQMKCAALLKEFEYISEGAWRAFARLARDFRKRYRAANNIKPPLIHIHSAITIEFGLMYNTEDEDVVWTDDEDDGEDHTTDYCEWYFKVRLPLYEGKNPPKH